MSTARGGRRPRVAGVSTRQVGDAGCLWQEIADYSDGRFGVVIGSCNDTAEAQRLRTATAARLRDGADLSTVLSGVGSPAASILAAVIDRNDSHMAYVSLGAATPTLATPGQPHHALEPSDGRVAVVPLPPGAAVVLATRRLNGEAHCATVDAQLLDDLLAGFPPAADPAGVVMVLYRQPPSPLYLILPAEPASLAVIRRRLRTWLAMTGADEETNADILLAVGEAATNAAEHAHDGSGRQVQISLRADTTGNTMRFTVSDNGSWKTPTESSTHRGHGIRLMKALLDDVAVTTTADGTTIEMLKELAG